jgi:predicted AAA+ superfamily ATPase
MANVTESLAGRIFIFDLLSLSLKEQMNLDPLTLDALKISTLRGGFPELVVDKGQDTDRWFKNYLQTYLERDVRQLRQVGNITDFQRFLELLASFNGQVLHLSNMSRDLGVAVNTVKSWLSVLEASHQVILIAPFYKNKGKRIIKSPRIYFLDTGLLCFLNGISSKEQIFKGPLAGALLENVVLGEILRGFHNRGEIPRIFWWRTSYGEEVDFILERQGKMIPIEIKMTSRIDKALTKNLQSFCGLFKNEIAKGYLVNLAKQKWKVENNIEMIPLGEFLKIV